MVFARQMLDAVTAPPSTPDQSHLACDQTSNGSRLC